MTYKEVIDKLDIFCLQIYYAKSMYTYDAIVLIYKFKLLNAIKKIRDNLCYEYILVENILIAFTGDKASVYFLDYIASINKDEIFDIKVEALWGKDYYDSVTDKIKDKCGLDSEYNVREIMEQNKDEIKKGMFKGEQAVVVYNHDKISIYFWKSVCEMTKNELLNLKDG